MRPLATKIYSWKYVVELIELATCNSKVVFSLYMYISNRFAHHTILQHTEQTREGEQHWVNQTHIKCAKLSITVFVVLHNFLFPDVMVTMKLGKHRS